MKTLYIILFGLISTVSYGQFTRGTIMVGGSLGASFNAEKMRYNNTTTVTGHTTSVSCEPQAGYFIIDNLAAGLGLDMYNSRYKDEDSDYKETIRSISISPFVRYYYHKFYGQASFQAGSSKYKDNGDGEYETKSTIGGWRVAAGYAFMLNESVAVEPQIGYASSSSKTGDFKSIDQGLFLRAAFQIYLHRK